MFGAAAGRARESEAPLVAEHLDIAGELRQERLEADGRVIDDDDLVRGIVRLDGDALEAAESLSRRARERHDDRDLGGHLPGSSAAPLIL